LEKCSKKLIFQHDPVHFCHLDVRRFIL
jgi:hypothetical protein